MRQFLRLTLGLFSILFVGTAGYYLIEGDWTLLESLYMTVITITTIGFGEVRELSDTGMVFTIVIIILGIGLAAAVIARLGQFVVESGIQDLYGRRKMSDRIKKLRNHYILCGYGRTGSAIARKLHESGIDFVVIDSSPDHVEAAGSEGYRVLSGDASSDPILLSAGIQRAAGTVLCVGDDATNVNIALAARELNPEQNIISRGTDPSLEYRLIRAGADSVVYPMRLGGEQIARSIADDVAQAKGGDEGISSSKLGYDLRVIRNSGVSRPLKEFLDEYEAVRPVAVRRMDGDMVHNPSPGDIVGENDSVLLLIREEKKNRVLSDIRILKWTDDLSTGAAKLDKDLKRLYKAAEEFQASVLESLGKDAVSKRHELLVAYAGGHFHRQETLMREKGYEGIEEHRLEHEELARLLAALGEDGRFFIEEEAWNALDRRLSQHVLDDDRSFAESLKARDAAG